MSDTSALSASQKLVQYQLPKFDRGVDLKGMATDDQVVVLAQKYQLDLSGSDSLIGPDGTRVLKRDGEDTLPPAYDATKAVIRGPEDVQDILVQGLRRQPSGRHQLN